MSFGLSMFRDLFSTRELAGSELVLVDTDPENLERIHGLAILINEKGGAGMKVSKAALRREARLGPSLGPEKIVLDRLAPSIFNNVA